MNLTDIDGAVLDFPQMHQELAVPIPMTIQLPSNEQRK